MTLMIDQRLSEYLRRIYLRRDQAVPIDRLAVRFGDGSRPQPACCHDNVDRWVREHPECVAQRGWLVSATSGDAILVDAHSVVRLADGRLVDITLRGADQFAPFIAHVGDADFGIRGPVNQIWLPLQGWPAPPAGQP